MRRIETPDPNLHVFDDVLPFAAAYRDMALGSPYQSYTFGPSTFHGIALAPPTVADWLRAQFPACAPTLTFFRQSPAGQQEPNFIHSDRSMGDWTALLYLTSNPPIGDGTTFWERRDTGERADPRDSHSAAASNEPRWRATEEWVPWHRVSAKFNRLVWFPAPYYHSRSLVENFGEGDSARLVNVTFGGFAIWP